jgi:ATPase family associated with various cellular activities (AAA)
MASTGYGKKDDSPNEVSPPKSANGATMGEEHEAEAYAHWSKRNGLYRPTGKTIDSVPSGIYSIDNDNQGWYLEKIKFPSDDLLRLPGMPIEFILDQIDKFWGREHLFKATKLLHKRGILLYGPAGCGKTSIIKLLCNDLVNRGGIVLTITNCRLAENALQGIRQIEPTRPILTIIEDIETYMGASDDSSSARALLAFLDGESQVDHIVHLATTNKPDLLEDRIIKRPGRFDLVVGLNQPVAEARNMYLRNLLKELVTDTEYQEMVAETKGLGLAHLRELVVASYCLGLDRKETLKRLRMNYTKKHKISDSRQTDKLGFASNDDDVTEGYTTAFPIDEKDDEE